MARDPNKPRVRLGAFGDARFPDAEDDLTMETMVRYRTHASVEEVARFFEAYYADAKPHIQWARSKEQGRLVFSLGVGPRYRGDARFGAIVVMTDPGSLKKRKPIQHILVTSRSGYGLDEN